MIAQMRRCKFIVADFTRQNQGVYFEAGFALGLGIEVIWCCRKNCMDFVHFDTRQRAHVVWDSPSEFREKLARRIESGSVFVNGMVASDPRLPFGGIKRSGYGRELSSFGAREFTNIQTIWIGPAEAANQAKPAE